MEKKLADMMERDLSKDEIEYLITNMLMAELMVILNKKELPDDEKLICVRGWAKIYMAFRRFYSLASEE